MSQSGQFTSLSGAISTLTGDAGGAISPALGNIDIFGGTGIVVTGTPASNLLTIDLDADVATTFTTDTGDAIPALNIINILGGDNIATSGAADTVTVAVSGTTDNAVQVGNASGSLTSIPVGTTGQVLIASTAADPAFSEIGNNSGLTAHGVLLAEGNSAFVATGVGSNGQLLIASGGSDPAFADLTSTGSTIAITTGASTLNVEAGATVPTSFTTDSGTAIPAANILDVDGGTNINTSGATNVLTVNLDAAITVDSVSTSPTTAGLTIATTDISADGTDVDIGITITPKGTGILDVIGDVQADAFVTSNVATNLEITDNSITAAGTDINIDIDLVPKGSGEVIITGATANAIPVYSATSGLSEIGPLTNGQIVIGSTAASAVAGSLTSTGSTLTITGGAGTLNVDITAPVSVANGGTGAITLTDFGVLVGSGTAAITPLAVGTDGFVLLGATAADPAFAALTSTGGTITYTLGANSLNLEASGGGLSWNAETGTTIAMTDDNGYIIDNAALNTATLPAASTVGAVFRLVGKGAGGWKLAQRAGQAVNIGTSVTTTGTGGSLASSDDGDCIELVCITTDTTFRVISSFGNITVV